MIDRLFGLVSADCKFEFCLGKKDPGVCRRMCTDAQHLVTSLLDAGVMIPPCKIGDIVYVVYPNSKYIHSVEVTKFEYTQRYGFDIGGYMKNGTYYIFNESEIGKEVFLTEEDAINELKERYPDHIGGEK